MSVVEVEVLPPPDVEVEVEAPSGIFITALVPTSVGVSVGEFGPPGGRGFPGPPGPEGPPGAASHWLWGVTPPADGLGGEYDFYLDTTTGDVFAQQLSSMIPGGN